MLSSSDLDINIIARSLANVKRDGTNVQAGFVRAIRKGGSVHNAGPPHSKEVNLGLPPIFTSYL